MAFGSYEEMIGPLLVYLARRDQPVQAKEAYEGVADDLGLSEEERRELLPSGTQPVYKNRIGWAHDALKRNGLSSSPRHGYWQIADLLHAMGYGTDRRSLQHVGGSGDGGIDGVISLDRLGLEKVYVQAKRWKNQVGSPEIQAFVGALQLRGATKGVLISPGPITRPAFTIAERANVVLIDGDHLTQLMIEYGIGVSDRKLRIPKIDSDYFNEL